MLFRRIYPIVFLLCFSSLLAVQVQTNLTPKQAHIGEALKYEIKLDGLGKGQTVKFPPPPENGFDLLQTDSSVIQTANSITYQLAVFDTGKFTILSSIVIVSNGSSTESLKTNSVTVAINSSLPDTAESIRQLKPYRAHPFQWRELIVWIWVVSILLLALIGWFLWKRYRKQKELAEIPIEMLLPAHELAIRELIALKDKKYSARGMLKEFYSEYSEIMRRYIERRYGFPALEMTTYDLEREFESPHFPSELTTKFVPSLREADLVKFAKYLPAFDECEKFLELGFNIVTLTKELPQTEPDEVKAA